MRLSVAMTPTRDSMPPIVVASASVRAPRSLPVIPCDPTPPSGIIAPPVEVAQLRSPEDRFRCLPLAAVLLARDCVKRQAIATGAADPEERTSTGGSRSWVRGGGGGQLREQFKRCRDCELGRAVQKRLTS